MNIMGFSANSTLHHPFSIHFCPSPASHPADVGSSPSGRAATSAASENGRAVRGLRPSAEGPGSPAAGGFFKLAM